MEVRIIPDVEKTIVKNIRNLSKNFNYVFTTGGIGPTHDDITAQSVAKAFKVKYGYHKEAYKILEHYYGEKKFNDGRKKMAKMPVTAKLIYNPSSAAPGFITKNVLSLPGVPSGIVPPSPIAKRKRDADKTVVFLRQLCCIPTISECIADRLVEKFGTLTNLQKALLDLDTFPEVRLSGTMRLGRTRLERLRHHLCHDD